MIMKVRVCDVVVNAAICRQPPTAARVLPAYYSRE